MAHHFAQDAVEVAYNEGEAWLDEMLTYVEGNLNYALEYFMEYLPEVKPLRPEGTYLLWLDCRGLNLDVKGLKDLMFNQAKVAFSEGSVFGTEGEGWLRINLACPRSNRGRGARTLRSGSSNQIISTTNKRIAVV